MNKLMTLAAIAASATLPMAVNATPIEWTLNAVAHGENHGEK